MNIYDIKNEYQLIISDIINNRKNGKQTNHGTTVTNQ